MMIALKRWNLIALLIPVLQATAHPSSSLSGTLARREESNGTAHSSASSRLGFNAAARAAGKLYFGTATNNYELNDTAYVAILDDLVMFGQLTPAKAMKWVRIS